MDAMFRRVSLDFTASWVIVVSCFICCGHSQSTVKIHFDTPQDRLSNTTQSNFGAFPDAASERINNISQNREPSHIVASTQHPNDVSRASLSASTSSAATGKPFTEFPHELTDETLHPNDVTAPKTRLFEATRSSLDEIETLTEGGDNQNDTQLPFDGKYIPILKDYLDTLDSGSGRTFQSKTHDTEELTTTVSFEGVTTHSLNGVDAVTKGPDLAELSYNVDKQGSQRDSNPCLRECVLGEKPKTCHFRFEVEWYYSMSKACYDCPHNTTDCDRLDCVTGDGFKRPLVVVNRQMPGPSVEVCTGDHIIVDLANHMSEESTSIHWHGHHQRGTPYMDGVPYVTQCPIPPRSTFRYQYHADTPGTHFWHSHSGSQRADGAYGSLIVRVPKSRDPHAGLYDADLPEHTLQIMDWDHSTGIAKFLAHHHADGDNKPPTLLVNGRGRYFKFASRDGEGDIYTPTTRFNVAQGVRYRFRLINAGFLNCPIQVSVDQHNLTIIASDGGDLEPIEAESLVTYAGERFDFIINADQPVDNYWLRLRGLMDCDERFSSAHQVAVIHYKGAPDTDPQEDVSYKLNNRGGFQVNALNARMDANDSHIIPELTAAVADDITLKPEADVTFYLSYDFYALDNPTFHKPNKYGFHQVMNKSQRLYTPQLNHITMRLPTSPLLSQPEGLSPNSVCNSSSVGNCTNRFCECTHLLRVPLGAVVELVLIDKGVTFDANHPFHLHGTAFRVVAMDRLGSNTTVEEVKALDRAGLIKRRLKKAPVKDTVTVPDGGYTIIRFHANNPGYWLLHCHIEFHVEMGMALIFQIGTPLDFQPVPHGFPRCGNYVPNEEDSEIEVIELNNTIPISGKSQKFFNLPPQYMVPPVVVIGKGSKSAPVAMSLVIGSIAILLLT